MAKSNSKAKSKSRITKAQAEALLKMHGSKMPMDAEDAADAKSGGAEEAAENAGGKLKFGSPEWRAKYSKKSKTVADALSAPGGK
jgi:hypothetical protein